MRVYNKVHTGANTQLGGEKKGFSKVTYQLGMADCVTLLESKPTPRERKTPSVEASISLEATFFITLKLLEKKIISDKEAVKHYN